MELTIEQALQQGVTAHKEGKLQDAERLYRAILHSQPLHPDANHNLGVLAVSVNKADVALPLFKTALEANPKIEQFWLSYMNALIKEKQLDKANELLEQARKQGVAGDKLNVLEVQITSINGTENVSRLIPFRTQLRNLFEHYQNGRFSEAEKLAISITQEFPKHQFAWKVLGAVLKKTGRISESLTPTHKSAQLEPKDAEAHNNLGVTLKELGRLEEAEASFTQAIALKPDYAEAYYNLGATLKELGRLGEAEASYTQAIALKPDYAEAYNNLGNTLKELDRLGEAEASFTQAIALKPNFAEAHSNLGNTFRALDRLGEAEASFAQAIALKPDYAEAYSNLGVTLNELGRLEEAEASFTQAIALKPDYAEAHRHLTTMKRYESQDEHYLKMRELYLDESTSEERLCHINFGLAKACEDLGNFEQAYAHYNEGNALRKKLIKYDISKDIELFKLIKSNYPRISQNSLDSDNSVKTTKPIFIVGMPRSGTTLVEQIISSHSHVTGAGELPFAYQFGRLLARGSSEINNASLLDFRENYLKKLQNIAKGNLIVTDKMPQNFLYIGLIFAAFPEAKIVHVKRNPAAVCWANYKQFFESKNLGYCYVLDDVIRYYRLYENLMEFWGNSFGTRIYNLDYELLTVSQENETHRLIDYLGLGWDEKCLSPQDNTRSVATASNMQVRKKVYQNSSQQWKKYEPFLNGSLDGLLLP